MTDWSYNYTAFIGSKPTLDTIGAAVLPDGDFDFEAFVPTPEVLDWLPAPLTVIPDGEFAAMYDLDKAPATIDEMVAMCEQHQSAVRYAPVSVHKQIIAEYTHGDWYTWRLANWGTKWTGRNAYAHRADDHLLIITHATAGAPPQALFNYLRSTYPELHIVNGSDVDTAFNPIDLDVPQAVFNAYFSITQTTIIHPYDYTDVMPLASNLSKSELRGIEFYGNVACEIDTDNIAIMREHGRFIGEDGEWVLTEKL